MPRKLLSLAACFLVTYGCVLISAVSADDKSANTDQLKQKGYKLSGDVVTATEESDVEKAFSNLKKTYKAVMDARQRLTAAEKEAENNREMIKQLANRRLQLGQLMAAQTTVSARNQVTLQFNLVTDELNMRSEADQKGEALTKAKAAYSTPRNDYFNSVLSMRGLIDKTKEKYTAAGKDTSLEALIEDVGKTEKKKVSLGPSKTFVQTTRDFERYEALIMSDKIALVRRSGTYSIEVTLNGKNPVKMIFDTGASSISLPYEMAVTAGLKPDEAKQKVKVSIANGAVVEGKRMKLDSVRVGKFELKNVDCIVMPEDSPNVPALLGGSFLNNFKYEVDADASVVRLSRIDSGASGGSSKTPGK
ncbi:MAG TPA: retropepsin-like aspartic protease [Gemmatales bacterium]|nr:retropepsin-like aspartic protease [Gemmatales bacterium]